MVTTRTVDHDVGAFYLGGYSTVTAPSSQAYRRSTKQLAYFYNWVANVAPDVRGWTKSTTGGTASVDSPGKLRIQTSSQVLYYYQTPTTTETQGITFRTTVERVAGDVDLRVRVGDGSAEAWIVDITVGATVTAADGNGGSLGSASVTGKLDFLIAVQGNTGTGGTGWATAWYRQSTTAEDQEWIELVRTSTLPRTTSGAFTDAVAFGAATSKTVDCYFYEAHFSAGTGYGSIDANGIDHLAKGQANPGDLFPRNYCADPVYVTKDTKIAQTDGATYAGDNWKISTEYQHAAANILPMISPSPRKTWRSTAATASTEIALQRGADAQDVYTGSGIVGVYLSGINFKRCKIQGRTGGSWTDLAAVDLFAACTFTRKGTAITFTNTTTAGFVHAGELAGGVVEYNNVDTGSAVIRDITHNTQGILGANTKGVPSVVYMDDAQVLSGDPTSGTCHVWSPNALILLYMNGNTEYEGYRIQMSHTGTTPASYHEIGQMVIGPVACFGWDMSQGRTLSKGATVDLETYADGSRRSVRHAPPRRVVNFAWAEGVDVTQARDLSAPELDYIKESADSAAEPLAHRFDAPILMQSLVDHLDGPHTPIVYIPYIERGADSSGAIEAKTYLFNEQNGAIYGRITSPIQLDTVVGDEMTNEVIRVASVQIEEEI